MLGLEASGELEVAGQNGGPGGCRRKKEKRRQDELRKTGSRYGCPPTRTAVAAALLLGIALAGGAAGGAPEPEDVVTGDGVDRVRELVSPGVRWLLRHGLEMRIVPTRPATIPGAFVEATEKYSGQVRLTPDGYLDTATYVAGLPFPIIDENDPQAAIKVAYNHLHRGFFTDDLERSRFGGRVGFLRRHGEAWRQDTQANILVGSQRVLRFVGRTEQPPHPALASGAGRLEMGGQYPFLEPYDLKGVGAVYHRHLDPGREDDVWVYLPSFRRVRRTPEAQLSDGLVGRDLDPHSFGGFNGRVSLFRWRLLDTGPKMGSLQWTPESSGCESEGSTVCGPWEIRSRVWTVEATPVVSRYGYGKRILHVDGEIWAVLTSDLFDRGGELWKVIVAERGPVASRVGLRRFTMVDIRAPHSTVYRYPHERFPQEPPWRVNRGVEAVGGEAWFAPESLVAGGR